MVPAKSVDSLIAAFDTANLVALGERHWAREDSLFRTNLVQAPAFAQKVNDIVVEFGNPLYQEVLDRFVYGEPISAAEVAHVWRDTTQPGAFDSPVYEEFVRTVRTVNSRLPASARLRIVAADYPIDWTARSTPAELEPAIPSRDRSAAAIIQREVLERNRKALLIFGSAHIYRNRPGAIVDLLATDLRAKWFIVVPVGGPGLPDVLTSTMATADDPALIVLHGSELRNLRAADVLEIGSKRIKVVDGQPVFADGRPVLIPVFDNSIRVGELADACLYFGGAPLENVEPASGLYHGTEYGTEVRRRQSILRGTMWPK